MIFVSGANGQFAGGVVRNLVASGDARRLVVGTRNIHSPFALELAAQGVTVREADFRNPEQMRGALAGVQKALFVPTYDSNDVRLQQNLNAIAAAKAAGVKHVVYASFVNAECALVEHSRLVHLPTEQAIRTSGLDFTILRHALYADILIGDLKDTLATGLFRRPGANSRSAYIARADLSFSAARVLQTDGHAGRVYSETMDRTYSGADVAADMSVVFGKPIRFQAVPAAEWPRYMTDNWGVPPEISKSTVGTMAAVEAGEFDLVSGDYKEITGRSARTLREFLAAL